MLRTTAIELPEEFQDDLRPRVAARSPPEALGLQIAPPECRFSSLGAAVSGDDRVELAAAVNIELCGGQMVV